MKTTLKFLAYVCLALVLTTVSCSKDSIEGPMGSQGEQGIQGQQGPAGKDGEALGLPGPQGEQGATGPAGANGTNGANGADGEDGNANVIASDWFLPTFTRTVQTGGTTYFDGIKAVPEITSQIVENGVVLVYAKLNGYNSGIWPTDKVGLLPITLIYHVLGAEQVNTWNALISAGNILIRDIENTDIHSGNSPYNRFRYIILPSNSAGKGFMNYSAMSYEEVIDHFGLDY